MLANRNGFLPDQRGRSEAGQGEHEGFEGAAEAWVAGKRVEAAGQVGGGSKVRIGPWLAENLPCPYEVDRLFGKILEALEARGMNVAT